ncbi:proline racemase family protein (plasmid) [Deinococcus radiomollis]|uniref:proline racemase family protein n=1 Tax=Deinococcus radiomollis TaxID=468916 RepID=UPI003891A73A
MPELTSAPVPPVIPALQIPVAFVDSHTAGEPTRVVIGGFPELPGDTLAEQRTAFAAHFDHWRTFINNEPRGSDVLVSALLVEPKAPGCVAGVIFFNNASTLGMCGHGTIGVVTTLAHLGRLSPGEHRLDTPVGVVSATLHPDGRVSVRNVPARRHLKNVTVEVPGIGPVSGDVAWGGNWFFLTEASDRPVNLEAIADLNDYTAKLKTALEAAGVTGDNGEAVDHIEVFAPGSVDENGTKADSRSFVLCPGGAYDRSPCGTGTSAKLACLAADGKLAPGELWVQESVIGSRFEARYDVLDSQIVPTITGRAYVTARGELLREAGDPFVWGIGTPQPQAQSSQTGGSNG